MEIRAAHAARRSISLGAAKPHLPTALVTVIDRLLAADPLDRPACAEDVREALLDVTQSKTIGAARPSGDAPTAYSTRRRWLLALGMTTLGVALAAGGSSRFSTVQQKTSGLPSAPSSGLAAATATPALSTTPVEPGHLLFPVAGINAIQEVDPVRRAVVQTLSLPPGYAYSEPAMALTVLVRRADRWVITNARNKVGAPVLLVLSDRGELRHAQALPETFPGPGEFLQQLEFDPADSTQRTILSGIPFSPRVVALNPFEGSITQRVSSPGGNFIGTRADRDGRVYVGNWSTGQVARFKLNPEQPFGELIAEGVFAQLGAETGSGAANAIAVDEDFVYVAQSTSRRVAKYRSSSGTLGGFISDPSLGLASSVFFDPVRRLLYVGSEDKTHVVLFKRDGTKVGVLELGGKHAGIPGLVPIVGDADGNGRIDSTDILRIGSEDTRPVTLSVCGVTCDLDGDGVITEVDERLAVSKCSNPECRHDRTTSTRANSPVVSARP